MKVLNEYPGSHHYWDEFEKTELKCPNCGLAEVWCSSGGGDYYVGPEHLCVACNAAFTMQGPSVASQPNDVIKLEQIRSGITKEPTTPKGN